MNNDPARPSGESDDMLPEYDFSRGSRRKHYREYLSGFTVAVRKADGTLDEREYALPEGAVLLDPDVQAYFPDSDMVNTALRGLIGLIPRGHTEAQ